MSDEQELQTDRDSDATEVERRRVLTAAAGIASAGAAGYLFGSETAAAAAAGEIGTATNPYLRAYVTTMNFDERTSDPSSPSDGELWYNSSA